MSKKQALINIAKRGTNQETDPYFRYKRSTIQTRIDPRQSHTHVTNLPEIALQLKVDLVSLAKALATRTKRKLNCNAVFDTRDNDTIACIYFTGEHANAVIDAVLQEMIEKYMICGQCSLPEYNNKTNACDSCGASRSQGPQPTAEKKITVEPPHLNFIPSWEIELSNLMKYVYAKRDIAKQLDKPIDVLDDLLDKAWNVDGHTQLLKWRTSCETRGVIAQDFGAHSEL